MSNGMRSGRRSWWGREPSTLAAPPLDLSGLGSTVCPARALAFLEQFCTITSGRGALKPFRSRPRRFEANRSEGARAGLCASAGSVSIPRGNGKSSLAAALALWALVDGPEGAEVHLVAGVSERQSRIAVQYRPADGRVEPCARRACPDLPRQVVHASATNATLRPYCPPTPTALLGENPSFMLIDELGVIDGEVFEAMRLASGKREVLGAARDRHPAAGTKTRSCERSCSTAASSKTRRTRSSSTPLRQAARSTTGRCGVVATLRSATSSLRTAWRRRHARCVNPCFGSFVWASGLSKRTRRGCRSRCGTSARAGSAGAGRDRRTSSRSTVVERRLDRGHFLHGRGRAALAGRRPLGEPRPSGRPVACRRARGGAHDP